MDAVEEIRDELHSIYNKIEDVLETSEVYDLASFEINHRINELLQTDYAMEAYEENLENCIEKASDAAILELLDLAALFYDLCKHRKWHKIHNGNRAGKAQGGLLPIIAY